MPEYTLSGRADKDLDEIYRFSYQHFGETKADEYLLCIEERFSQLAQQPFL